MLKFIPDFYGFFKVVEIYLLHKKDAKTKEKNKTKLMKLIGEREE